MSETYLITAKTVEEAIAIANSEYADEKHEISYDIIDMPKKGFLGIGVKPAKIKVTVTESVSADLGSLVDDIRGMKNLTSRGEDDRKSNNQKKNNNQKNNNNQKKNDKKPEAKPEEKAEKPAERPAEKKQGGLSNQVKKKQRNDKPHTHGEEISASGVTVAAPIGISDFKTEAKGNFGTGKSSGRISNDIKKKKKNTPAAPAKETPAAPAAAPVAVERPAEVAKAAHADENTSKKHLPLEEDTKLREAVTEAEMEYALEFVNKLLSNMKLTATAEAVPAPEGEEYIKTEIATVYPKINIVGDDTGILIGHHGETLDAIQYLANLSAIRRGKQSDGDYVKIVLDIENYREKREETLRTLARRMANKAIKYKRNVFLEPMNAYERHIIHSELHSVENVSTHSVGSDRDRKIIITYEGADKQSDRGGRRRRGRGNGGGEKREGATVEKAESTEKTGEHKRRPRKIQKMPIEKLPDFLAAAEGEPEQLSEIEY